MDADFYLQRALTRLGDDRIYYDYRQRTPSNLKLLEEYLHRLRLWMERLNMPFERWWQASDLAEALDPQISVSAEIHQWAFKLIEQRPYPYGVDELTFENMLRWETLKQQRPELIATHNLPDPYEPFILLLRRGGGFFFGDEESVYSYEDENILHLTAGDLSLLSREIHWLTRDIQNLPSPETPIVSLDEKALNIIDTSTPKLYGFLPDDRSNHCGVTSNGNQYLLYSINDLARLFIMRFSASGELIEVIEKEDFENIYYDEELAEIAAELGIHEMQMTVQKFFFPQYPFGIKDLPYSIERFLADRSIFPEAEHEDYKERIVNWLIGGKFVLQLGPHHDYWLSIEGHVTST